MNVSLQWGPAAVLAVGAMITVGPARQSTLPLRQSLDQAIPTQLAGFHGRNLEISEIEQRVAGMTSYVMRVYSADALSVNQETGAFSVYVGYYANQTQGRTIHSPKNCLPGAGWEALASAPVAIETPSGPVHVNRYLLQRGEERAMVLYWYQGRGRIEANEYRVKWNLLRDAALKRRSDEALVRVLVPAPKSEADAYALAVRVARALVPAVNRALPDAQS